MLPNAAKNSGTCSSAGTSTRIARGLVATLSSCDVCTMHSLPGKGTVARTATKREGPNDVWKPTFTDMRLGPDCATKVSAEGT